LRSIKENSTGENGTTLHEKTWEDLLTVTQVSKMLNVSPKTVYLWCDLHIIPHYRLGGSIRFDLDEIKAWVKSCKVPVAEQYNTVTVTGSPKEGG
jgi:excisionase family DNA binding protein